MSKEYLEAFEVIRNKFIDLFHEDIPDFDTVENALNRLKTIDDSNPSEALLCLEYLYCGPVDYISSDRKKDYDIIKQALLKGQNSKKYLKWEDLEFSYGTKVCKVRMGNTIYKIECAYYNNVKEVKLLSEDEKCFYLSFTGNYEDNVQLFNDLHLEKVDENSNV